MTNEQIKNLITEYQELIKQYSHLKDIFTPEYYSSLQQQLKYLTKDHGTKLNPIFLWFLRERQNSKNKLQLLSKHVNLVFSATTSNNEKKHIAGQLRSLDAYDTVFELGILSALIEEFAPSNIELFPTTTQNHDVEARAKLVDRWVYIEASVLRDSKEDSDELTELLRSGKGVGEGKWIDMDKDKIRYFSKSEFKAQQFLPNTPSVLILAMIALRPALYHFTEIDHTTVKVENIGAIMEFDIDFRYRAFREGVKSCSITQAEKEKLIKIFNVIV